MTSTPQDLLVPSTFPVDPATCQPIAPNQYLKVNTIFNVAHDHGMLTAWSDKHPVYTSFNGPSGNGITDSFDPEIDSNALQPNGQPWPGPTIAWTGDNAATMQYDSYKVQAVINWIDDGSIMAGVNSAWAATHPGAPPLVAAGTDDDAIMWWLSDTSPQATRFVQNYLWIHSATGNTATGASRTLPHSGLRKLYVGAASARYFGVPVSEPRHPDVWGIVQVGVVYTGGKGKIAEHGGANPADRGVPIVVYAPGLRPQVSDQWVETTQIAPTIMQLLGLNPGDLQAVQAEGTPVLPGISGQPH
ncbi:MAG TPA: hypothetical protein VG294_05165 [Solirubrobacteraceae bacterium]|jgi:hypothetical protein|nr:hypothetical protein [Solirubrobacteraceae bacterium]